MMKKFGAISLVAFGCSLSAFADRGAPLASDPDFLAKAYEAADSGKDFSYARIWGEGRAYDGTDTSAFFADLSAQAAKAETATAAETTRSNFITRAAINEAAPANIRIPLRGRLTE